MTRFLVTGGGGFIGSHLAQALLRKGGQVRILDNFSTGLRENVAELPGAEVVEGDIRSYHVVREAVEGIDVVLHQAALPSVPRSVRDPLTSNEVNVGGTLNLLTAARDAGVGRLVYASSSSVYGRALALPKRETMSPDPASPYAISKLAAEQYCRAFTDLYGFETVVLRYFNVFGPRQSPRSEYAAVVPRFIQAIQRGETPVIYGDGSQTRDFTFVGNVVEANILAAERDGVSGRVMNIATGTEISLLAMVQCLERILGVKARPTFAPRRPGDVENSCASIDLARSLLGYTPRIQLEEGLRITVEALKSTMPVGPHGPH